MHIGALVAGLLPVFATIALGFFLKRRIVPNEEQWSGMERITFVLLIPSLIIKILAEADLSKIPIGPIASVLIASIVAMILILAVLYPIHVKATRGSVPAYTSVFQTATRWNAFVAIAIAGNLYGDMAVAIIALGMIVLIPIVNIVNVSALTWLLTEGRVSLPGLLWKILTNPIIVGCLVGTAIGLSGVSMWQPAMDVLSILGEASLGIILLCVGAGLKLADVSHSKQDLFISCMLKLAVMPAMAMGFGLLLGLEGLALTTVVVIAAMPTATNGYILAREMGGDAPLYANAASLQILLSFVTIPFWLEASALIGRGI